MDATPWNELVRYVGFDHADAARLRGLLPHVEPHLGRIVDNFYAAIVRHEEARAVLIDDDQVERLKITLKLWTRELLTGPHDDAYWARRERIGRRHARVGLPARYIFGAMNLLRGELLEVAAAALSPQEYSATCKAVMRVTDIELAVMTDTYMDARQERELRTLQDLIVTNMPVTVMCLDQAGRVTSSTRIAGDEVRLGLSYSRLLPPELVAAMDRARKRASASGNDVTLPRVTCEGRHYRVTILVLRHELADVLVHIEEFTDVVEAESRAAQAESLAVIGSLAANVAHEIRNPLAAISATLQVIGQSLDAEDHRRSILDKVTGQVRRLDRLVTDLLGYARPAEPSLKALDIEAVAREALIQSGVDAELQIVQTARVEADPHLLQQVLVNLLQNARDVADAVILRVDGGTVEVEDDGPGIDPAVRSRLFEPFVTSKARGTGLGLAISRKLAASMGATLELNEAPTRFRLNLSTVRASPGGTEGRSG